MPITKSAIKAMRQSRVRQKELAPVKTKMKTMIRKVKDLAAAGKLSEAIALLPATYKAIDTAAKKNLIHRKNAAHKKSLVAKLVGKKRSQ